MSIELADAVRTMRATLRHPLEDQNVWRVQC